jgi:type II secretory pathway component PulK
MIASRRGVILPVVLVVLLVLGVLVAGYSFSVHADLSALQANTFRMQTRMAAEAGVQKVILMLRASRFDMDVWYNNPDELHRVIVWAAEEDQASVGTDEEYGGSPGYRFSIVADDPTDDEDFIRFGLTDEASKLNLNTATDLQLLTLVRAAMGDEEQEILPQDIVDAMLDWRDPDSESRSDAGDTEGDYYDALPVPYKVKNANFDTVEELLLVKGVTPRLLYGEDFDRNGLLTDNEDDGDESFPMDNQDGVLNLGLYPYLTTIAYESNVANDNRERVNLLGNAEQVRAELDLMFPDEPAVVAEIVAGIARLSATGGGDNPTGGGAGGGRGGRGGGNPTGGEAGDAAGAAGTAGGRTGATPGTTRPTRLTPATPGTTRPTRLTPATSGDTKSDGRSRRIEPDGLVSDPKSAVRSQAQPSAEEDTKADEADEGEGQTEAGDGKGVEAGEGGEGDEGGAPGAGQAPPTQRLTSPAALFLPAADGSAPANLNVERHLAILMDKTTVLPAQQREIRGLVNVNTASALVLGTLPGLDEELAASIVAARQELEWETKATTAWLVTDGVMDLATYVLIAPMITARAQQFSIESLGYADHIGMVTRLHVVIDTVGPLAQVVYYRDLSHLGATFPIREADKENIRVR